MGCEKSVADAGNTHLPAMGVAGDNQVKATLLVILYQLWPVSHQDGKEGRIQYYGKENYLALRLADWYYTKSAGNGSITCRMNSNDYMYSLVHDFGFEEKRYRGYTTADIFPPSSEPYRHVWTVLKNHLRKNGRDDLGIENIFRFYTDGWNE